MEKAYEITHSVLAFPGDRYSELGQGGGTGPYVNGASTPGTTGAMGGTGPLGAPIDTRNFDKLLVIAAQAGGTGASPAQSASIDAMHGSTDGAAIGSSWTGVDTFSLTLAASEGVVQKVGEIDCSKLQRYVWIRNSVTGLGEQRLSVQAIGVKLDKVPSAVPVDSEGP